ncbi:MAG: acyltransferase [Candidatus Bathyarchaeia archaeon]
MANLGYFCKSKIGLRTFYKTLRAQTATGQFRNRKLLIDGKTNLSVAKTAKIVNNGYLALGIESPIFFPSANPCTLTMEENSRLIINGATHTGRGVTVLVGKNASIELGNNLMINSNTTLVAAKGIKIGDNSGIGWGSEIIDSDFHPIVREGAVMAAPIEIGSHVFIGRHVMIMKGVRLGDGSVIAAGSVVTRSIPERCLAGGVPAKVIRENVEWHH